MKSNRLNFLFAALFTFFCCNLANAEFSNNDCFWYNSYIKFSYDSEGNLVKSSATQINAGKDSMFEIQFDYVSKNTPQCILYVALNKILPNNERQNLNKLGVFTDKINTVTFKEDNVTLISQRTQITVENNGIIIVYFYDNGKFTESYFFKPDEIGEQIYRIRYDVLRKNLLNLKANRDAGGEYVAETHDIIDSNIIQDEGGHNNKLKNNQHSLVKEKLSSNQPANGDYSRKVDNDLILLRNGGEINALIIEISQSEIKYKRASNPNGPLYTIDKNEVEKVVYPNGEMDLFAFIEPDDGNPKQQEAVAAADNSTLIKMYNKEYPTRKGRTMNQKKIKSTTLGFVYWGITNNSILSTDDIEIKIINSNLYGFHEHSGMYKNDYRYAYVFKIYNKTDKPIYLDLGNTFKVVNNKSYVWHDGTRITETKNSNVGGGINLGAITNVLGIGGALGTLASGTIVGGSKGNSTTIDKSMQRFLAVAPNSTVTLPPRKNSDGKNVYEWFDATSKDKLRKWELTKYSEETAPFTLDFYITYSTDQNFKNYYVLPIHLYSRGIYGTPMGEIMRVHSYNLIDTSHFIYGKYY